MSQARGRARAGRDAGFAALQVIIFGGFLISMLMLIAGFGRVGDDRQLVEEAAGTAARIASLQTSAPQAAADADQAARQSMTQAGAGCAHVDVAVDVSAFRPGGQVSVTVRCASDLTPFSLAGFAPTVTVTATSTAPIDTLRAIQSADS